jgi:hypothetical protein
VTRRRWATIGLVGGGLYLATLAVNRSLVEVRGGSMEPSLWAGDRLLTLPARRGGCGPGGSWWSPTRTTRTTSWSSGSGGWRTGRAEVLGDNAAASTDSRRWGPLPLDAVRRVVVRRWPDLRTRLHR